ncbi:MAG: hypothetical protein CMD43_01185 [Gammaproteobacteria bacterium]|jgi:hypothetical protein|nr:hypothetical protein [Gammaproteobacteria bacterium]
MGSRGRPPARNLTPKNIKWAIESTQSMRQAADYLNVSYNSFRKYAEMYDLWSPRKSSKGIRRSHSGRLTHDIGKILRGEHPSPYRESTLLMKGIREGYFEACCSNCNADYTHISGKKLPPLIIDFLDTNPQNTKQENIRVLCFNCVYELHHTPKGWYRHRDNPIVKAYDDVPPKVDQAEPDVPQGNIEPKKEDLEFIPFENFQKMLDNEEKA